MSRTVERDLYAKVGLAQIPHILSMVDRNPLSPTYGCFDRAYWHYKTSSFPSGMYQEFVLPLALVYQYDFPGGETYKGRIRIQELVAAGIRYAARSSHRDGSCDDYYPYERALGAVAFSLYGATESYLLLGLEEEDMVDFFRRRGQWLITHQESGRLSNHQALTVLALYNVHRITGDPQLMAGVRSRLETLLQWQTNEGWFPEYEGCDPGYLTATIDFLAKYYRKSQDIAVLDPLKAAIRFASQFIHPDGSYGGEYGSRNTFLFFPHGFELMAAYSQEARQVADLYIMRGISEGYRVHLDDDRLCAHLSYNHLQAYLDFWGGERGEESATVTEGRYWSGARLYLHRDERRYAVVSTAKGGVIRLYVDGQLAYADSGIIVRLADGTTLVSHLVGDYEVSIKEKGIQVAGHFGSCRYRLPTGLSQTVFHLAMLTVGRWNSDAVRGLLQRILILGKRKDSTRFRRTILFGQQVDMTDEIWKDVGQGPGRKVEALYAGTDHTSIYVAVSQSYQHSCLLEWTNYGEFREVLNREGYVRIERTIG
ncbi:MAG: hypothetical protein JSU72_11985 [Deltaproteobacteria bacterium]|nr:MAG: hypothetical protein JSU72_11985 [Deltaproteobacteria bacterium]